jgi:hypothetical protein
MKIIICKKCGLVQNADGTFQPKVGKTLSKSTAFNLVCQYGNRVGCLNTAVNATCPDSDSWEKRRM